MTAKIFDANYSDQYDLLYGEKNYEAECDVLEEIFRRNFDDEVETILDLGCGTGNHAIPLAQRGYQVTGVDFSPEMLAHARTKAQEIVIDANSQVNEPLFYESNLRDFEIDTKFDVVLMMFAVLGYQLQNDHVLEALSVVKRYLRSGGLFVFDVWYGPAVLAIKPGDRIKVIKLGDGRLIRAASGSLDTFHHTAEVNYHLWCIDQNQVISETEENHRMRYFFPQELAFFLHQAGLELKGLTAFPNWETPASEESWNVLGIARN